MRLTATELRILRKTLIEARQWVLALFAILGITIFTAFVFISASLSAIKPNYPNKEELENYILHIRLPIFLAILTIVIIFLICKIVYLLRIENDNEYQESEIIIAPIKDRKTAIESKRVGISSSTFRSYSLGDIVSYKVRVFGQWIRVREDDYVKLLPGTLVHIKYLPHSRKVVDLQIVEIKGSLSNQN